MIVHFTTKDEWDAAKEGGSYAPEKLEQFGYVHCSYPAQAPDVANELFADRDDVVLLWIPSELDFN